jgi:RNA polymerase sigma factor (sigma-70 family)
MARPLHGVLGIPSHTEDQALVDRVRGGDESAFEELFCRYRARIGAYVSSILGDSDRAEDVTQEVFISALRRLRATDRPIAFKPWAYQIAKNACIDELRRARRGSDVPLDADHECSGSAAQLFSREPSPHSALESKQQLQDLRAAFRGLSELHRRIVVLREFEGLSYSEIGERLGMSRHIVESSLFRARRRLVEEYEELSSGERCGQTRALIDAWRGRRLRRLGIRERRRLVRHLAHCRPCRRHVFLAGSGRATVAAAEAVSTLATPGKAGPTPVGAGRQLPAPVPIALAGGRRTSPGGRALLPPGPDSRAVA